MALPFHCLQGPMRVWPRVAGAWGPWGPWAPPDGRALAARGPPLAQTALLRSRRRNHDNDGQMPRVAKRPPNRGYPQIPHSRPTSSPPCNVASMQHATPHQFNLARALHAPSTYAAGTGRAHCCQGSSVHRPLVTLTTVAASALSAHERTRTHTDKDASKTAQQSAS